MPTPFLSRRQRCALFVIGFGLGVVFAGVVPSAHAATPETWAAHQQEATAACVAASALQGARAAGQPIEFDDSIGTTALLITGRHAAAHMQGQRARELCLFDKQSRKAAVALADSLFGPMSRP
jgi:hypothetical protein